MKSRAGTPKSSTRTTLGRHGPRSAARRSRTTRRCRSRGRPTWSGFYGGLTSTIPRLYEMARLYQAPGRRHHRRRAALRRATTSSRLCTTASTSSSSARARRPSGSCWPVIEGRRELGEVRGHRLPAKDGQVVRTPDAGAAHGFRRASRSRLLAGPLRQDRDLPGRADPRLRHELRVLHRQGQAAFRLAGAHAGAVRLSVETQRRGNFFIVDDLFGQNRDETHATLSPAAQTTRSASAARLRHHGPDPAGQGPGHRTAAGHAQAGINIVAIGFESPIAEELKAMNKRLDPQEMIELARVLPPGRVPGARHVHLRLPAGREAVVPHAAQRSASGISAGSSARPASTRCRCCCPVPLPGTELTTPARASRTGSIPWRTSGWEYYDGNFPLFQPDEPITAPEMQEAGRQIMGRFYRFRQALYVVGNILIFPAIAFYFHNLRLGWGRWYRSWRNNLIRFGGWVTMRKWRADFGRGDFLRETAGSPTTV